MFKAVIDDSKLFKDSINLIGELVNEGVFTISKEGLKLIAMDPANVAMIIFQMLPSAFSQFNLQRETKVGLSIDKLKGVLRRVTGSEKLILSVEESQFNLEIIGNYKRRFTLPLLDIEQGDIRIPNLEFTSKVELKSDALKDGVEDVSIISDSITLIAMQKSFIMKSAAESSEVVIELTPSNSEALVNLEVSQESKSKYSTEYLAKMIKASKIAETLTLNFKKDYPLKLDYVVLDKLKISFILAPRVETE